MRAREEARRATALRGETAEHPHDPVQVVAASRQLFQMGRIAEALPALQRVLTEHPEDMPTRAALAYALGATGNLSAAIAQYREMLQREPQSAVLQTNLAVLLLRVGAVDEAQALLLRAAELAPEHANTAFTLGELFDQQKHRDQAFHHYQRATALFSRQIGTRPTAAQCDDLVKLASARMWIGDLRGALAAYDRAIELRPNHALALTRRGLALAKLRRVPEAVQSLKQAAAVEPNLAEIRRAIGDLLREAGATEAAQPHYKAALRINPHDVLSDYFLSATGKSAGPSAPPPGYVEKLFDNYAQQFEKHLVEILQYRAPELLCEAIQRITQPPLAAWNVIDLGCGTGLCGPLIRPFAARLTGVDLSAAMLEQAREKSVYDDLVQGDVSTVFGGLAASMDLALSADVFIYLGSLTPIFSAAGIALRPGGWFAFTTEAHDADGYMLDTTGRYRHARAYVETEAAAAGLETVHVEAVVARYQGHQPVMSDLYILRRAG